MRALPSSSELARVAGGFLLLASAACATPAGAPDAAAPGWSVVVSALGAGALSRCARDGQACAPLAQGATIDVGAGGVLVRSSEVGKASLALDVTTTLELGPNASIALEQGRIVQIEAGTALVTRAAKSDAAPIELRAGGASIELDPALADVVAIEAVRADRADVAVRRGKALARGTSGAPVELRAGDGARVAASSADRRAALGAPAPAGELGASASATARPPRGLGTVRARVPGTETIVGGVRLVAHRAKVTLSGGLARTEIEEEFQNDGAEVLEGRFEFPLPLDCSVSRLALWVSDKLVEGEVVERDKAKVIMRSIADDTLRRRDPALLEWAGGGELALTIYPIPAKGRRKVLLAYDQPLASGGGEARFVLPLSLGADRANVIDELAIDVAIAEPTLTIADVTTPGYAAKVERSEHAASAHFDAKTFTPSADFVVRYERPVADHAEASTYRAARDADAGAAPIDLPKSTAQSGDTYVAIRIAGSLPTDAPLPARAPMDRAIVVDVSQSQSRESIAGAAELALALVRQLDPDETFVLLACDSACATFPATGRALSGDTDVATATTWLAALRPLGSSDVAGAIAAAAARLEPNGRGQIVYLGDGAPTSGELSLGALTTRVRHAVDAAKADLRLVGVGRGIDDGVLGGIARNAGATYEALGAGPGVAPRIADLARRLRAQALVEARLELPAGVTDVFPKALPNLSLGEELLVAGRVTGPLTGEAKLSGRVGGAPYSLTLPLREADEAANGNPAIARLWAEGRIHELEGVDDAAALRETIALSKRFHVMSRITSLLVLENDRMFAEFGVARTVGQPDGTVDQISFGGLGISGTTGQGAAGGISGVGTIGSLSSIPIGEGYYGNGHGRLSGGHTSRPPQIRMGATTVNGRLPPEVIQRIVRQNFGRFRLCYENGLRSNPDLQGRVSVKFVIGRDGSVSTVANGGSDLPDGGVVSCVVRAFQGLSFPEPEGGIVTVVYPIMFSPGEPEPGAGPAPLHRAGDGTWMTEGDADVAKLTAELAAAPMSRARHEALIRGLLAHGRFDKVREAAALLLELDPELVRAHELSAYAAAASGDERAALGALDSEVELAPELASRHLRAARAFEAAGDERRACAHWRSLGELAPKDLTMVGESIRCRARVLDEKEGALAEAKALKAPGLPKLVAALEAGTAPAYVNDAVVGYFDATMTCAEGVAHCPTVLVVGPRGTVLSPWTPQPSMRSSKNGVSFANLERSTYHTLVVGGDPDAHGELALRVLETTPKFPVQHGGTQSIVSTTVWRTEYENRLGSGR